MSQRETKQRSKLARFGIFMCKLLIASLATFIIASVLHTHSVLSDLIAVGAEIPFMMRIETVFIDMLGLLPTYGLIILVGMLIAMPVAGFIIKMLGRTNKSTSNATRSVPIFLYALAGGLAIFCILAAMHPILNVTMIAGARGWSGMLSQSVAGVIGGAIFALIGHQLAFKGKAQ